MQCWVSFHGILASLNLGNCYFPGVLYKIHCLPIPDIEYVSLLPEWEIVIRLEHPGLGRTLKYAKRQCRGDALATQFFFNFFLVFSDLLNSGSVLVSIFCGATPGD